jgi:hypothetical protein
MCVVLVFRVGIVQVWYGRWKVRAVLQKLLVAQQIDIPRLLWDPKVHYCVHKIPPQVLILGQMNQFLNFPSQFLNIILPFMPSKWSLPMRFSDQETVHFAPQHTACSAYLTDHLIMKYHMPDIIIGFSDII